MKRNASKTDLPRNTEKSKKNYFFVITYEIEIRIFAIKTIKKNTV